MDLGDKVKKLFVIGSAIAVPFVCARLAGAEDGGKVVHTYDSKSHSFKSEYVIRNGDIEYRYPVEKRRLDSRHYTDKEKAEKRQKEKELEEKIKALEIKTKKEVKKEDFYQLAELYEEKGEIEKAIYVLSIGTTTFRKDAKMYRKLGFIIDDPQESIKQYKRALEINSNDINALVSVGYNLWLLGEKEEALEYYKKAAKLGDEEAKQWLLKQAK